MRVFLLSAAVLYFTGCTSHAFVHYAEEIRFSPSNRCDDRLNLEFVEVRSDGTVAMFSPKLNRVGFIETGQDCGALKTTIGEDTRLQTPLVRIVSSDYATQSAVIETMKARVAKTWGPFILP